MGLFCSSSPKALTDIEFDRLIADLGSIQVLYISDDAPNTRAVIDKAIAELVRLRKGNFNADR